MTTTAGSYGPAAGAAVSDAASGSGLEIHDLRVAFPTANGIAFPVNGVSFSVAPGQVRGIVGESGSGKTMMCRAILGLVPWPGAIVSGQILWNGRDLATASKKDMARIRGREISMVFQDPASALDPVFTIGDQISEPLRVHLKMSRSQARKEAIELLGRVGIPSPRDRYDAYPHQLSGGMRQRAMIAIAVSCRPQLILADEPTTNLDVTIQDQILGLLGDLRDEFGMGMILVSHDLGVVAQNADSVAVMYSGFVVESAPTASIFEATKHPYTDKLIRALPSIIVPAERTALPSIPGQPPDLADLPPGCPFAPRCPSAQPACAEVNMARIRVDPRHDTACPFAAAGLLEGS
jgi:oligopeptide/dipeptide ABC transporter ATP-binding protein